MYKLLTVVLLIFFCNLCVAAQIIRFRAESYQALDFTESNPEWTDPVESEVLVILNHETDRLTIHGGKKKQVVDIFRSHSLHQEDNFDRIQFDGVDVEGYEVTVFTYFFKEEGRLTPISKVALVYENFIISYICRRL